MKTSQPEEIPGQNSISGAAAQPRQVVIDTQSLFDWLIFGNPACAGWDERLDAEWRWVHSEPMRAEFDYVARRGFGERWPVDDKRIGKAWSKLGHLVGSQQVPSTGAGQVGSLALALALAPGMVLRCTDPDDQMFIDLAIAVRAEVLVTRDRALLRLARRAALHHGIRICKPADW